nr:hypothetical protein [Tanacetum cinerariifolium]
MASGDNSRDAKYALSRLLQRELLRARPTTLGEAFSLARLIKARFEAIAEKEKEQIIKRKADTILSLQSELASPEVKGSLDADEDIGVDEVSSAIDGVLDSSESNVESIKVHSKFGEFSKIKESVEEVVVSGGKALGVDEDGPNRVISVLKDGGGEFDDNIGEINLGLREECVIRVLEDRDVFGEKSHEVFSITPWVAKGERRVLCYVQELLRARPTTLGEAFSLARLIEARFEAIAEKEKEQIIKKKADIILSLQSELASPEVKGSLDADEDIGVDEVISTIDGVLDSGEINVKSMEVRRKFGEFSENKESVEEVVVSGGKALGVDKVEPNRVISVLKDGGGKFDDYIDEINLGLIKECVIRVLDDRDVSSEKSREVFSITPWVAKGERRVLCYVQGSRRRKRKKVLAAAVEDGTALF